MNDDVKIHKSQVSNSDPNITMTPAAIAHVVRFIEKRGSGVGLRLSISTTGCSGFAYVLDIIDAATEGDLESPINEKISVFVDPKALPYVKGTELDYIQEGINHKFIYRNPNEKGTCGCGESFSI